MRRLVVVVVAALALLSARPVLAQPVSGSSSQRPPHAPAWAAPGLVLPQSARETTENPMRRLSLDDAVALALEQNLDIRVERLTPLIQDVDIADARSAWAPNVSTSFTRTSQDTPSSSQLAGGADAVLNDTIDNTLSLAQRAPWLGGRYTASWNNSRLETSNTFASFDPTLRSSWSVSYTQPLVRDFTIDTARQRLLVSRKNREISDVQLRETVVRTVRAVRTAYWDLVFALSSLEVQRQSLDLARDALRNTRVRVELGTMAAIDIVEAEAEVARNEETVILAEAAIGQAEDRLRALILEPSTPDFWTIRLEPVDAPQLHTWPIDVDAAVRNALDQRTDLQALRKTRETADINITYARNQTLPDVSLEARYLAQGLGGTRLIRPALSGGVVDRVPRGFGAVLGDLFQNAFPTWTLGVSISYPFGTSGADASLARARLQRSQTELRIRNLELQIATQVRDVGRQVTTNLKRVEVTGAARALAERRHDAEQQKFTAGTSTSFLVFQAQRDLAAARNNELRAILDYNRSLVDFEAVQQTAIGSGAAVVPSQRGGSVN
ncbi:MAG: TolC family protein [Acidobacteria bacterium]|nr:TolC family protein [Acidobacteriota bacterium]